MKHNIFATLPMIFSALLSFGFAAPTDTIPPLMPPIPPLNHELAPHIRMNRSEQTTLTNLVIFIRFADDSEFVESLEPIDLMFNDTTPGNISVHNYYNVMTYGKINYNTVYTNDIQNSTIVSYQDTFPRAYFEPFSDTNPIGYEYDAIETDHSREYKLLGRVLQYVDSLHLVDTTINLDGNNDGLIDNISFILKGDVGLWAGLLWPHMGFFNTYSAGLSNDIYINGKMPCCYNFEFANSGYYFSANVFCHEMGHSLGIPDYYHYYDYSEIAPVGKWDQMAQNNLQQVSAIIKYKFLGIVDEPVEIVEDGHYVLNSLTSSEHNNCYFIRSSIDPDQWYTIEYRNSNDFMENVPHSGVIIGRWYDHVNLNDLYDAGNGMFDFFEKPHTYWVFRRNSNIDTINGNLNSAAFGYANRTSFGPTTNPYPYLTDGTPENSFEITNIQYSGDQASFDVHFLHDGVQNLERDPISIYPNPAQDQLFVNGDNLTDIEICDILGKTMLTLSEIPSSIDISFLKSGIYLIKISSINGISTKKFVKQ